VFVNLTKEYPTREWKNDWISYSLRRDKSLLYTIDVPTDLADGGPWRLTAHYGREVSTELPIADVLPIGEYHYLHLMLGCRAFDGPLALGNEYVQAPANMSPFVADDCNYSYFVGSDPSGPPCFPAAYLGIVFLAHIGCHSGYHAVVFFEMSKSEREDGLSTLILPRSGEFVCDCREHYSSTVPSIAELKKSWKETRCSKFLQLVKKNYPGLQWWPFSRECASRDPSSRAGADSASSNVVSRFEWSRPPAAKSDQSP
jgi:hypothetical protein